MDILTLNCGSSSVKYQIYRWDTQEVRARGSVERIGIEGSLVNHYSQVTGRISKKVKCPDHREAIRLITSLLIDPKVGVLQDLKDITVVGHRMVHGGEEFAHSVIIDHRVMETFRKLADLAPLHNPPNISGVEASQEIFPDVPHCAIMDTAWHQTMPPHAFIYGLPHEWYQNYGVRRYGFHGTSFLYVAKRASVLLGKNPFKTNLILLHIGNGASANAVQNGVSIDTSMGFTPLEGLLMGTRAGDHDPAIGFHIMKLEKLDVSGIESVLNRRSGILGITQTCTDRRDVLEAIRQGNDRAKLALDIETYRLKKYVGAYSAILGRVDAIVFTAGVGEMSPDIRAGALRGIEEFGIKLSPNKNRLSVTRNAETEITAAESKTRIFVIPTDEELVMSEDSYALLQGIYDVHTRYTYRFQRDDYTNKERNEAFLSEVETSPRLKDIAVYPPGNSNEHCV